MGESVSILGARFRRLCHQMAWFFWPPLWRRRVACRAEDIWLDDGLFQLRCTCEIDFWTKKYRWPFPPKKI